MASLASLAVSGLDSMEIAKTPGTTRRFAIASGQFRGDAAYPQLGGQHRGGVRAADVAADYAIGNRFIIPVETRCWQRTGLVWHNDFRADCHSDVVGLGRLVAG